jgi:hypothetical protein
MELLGFSWTPNTLWPISSISEIYASFTLLKSSIYLSVVNSYTNFILKLLTSEIPLNVIKDISWTLIKKLPILIGYSLLKFSFTYFFMHMKSSDIYNFINFTWWSNNHFISFIWFELLPLFLPWYYLQSTYISLIYTKWANSQS